jgi:hypothetical protein
MTRSTQDPDRQPPVRGRLVHRRWAQTARVLGLALAGGLALGGAVWPLGPAQAAAPACWDVPVDLDGGGPDVVVGLPSYDLAGKPDAGAIVVFSNVAKLGDADPQAPTKRTLLTADDFSGLTAQAGARFGASVVAWRDMSTWDDGCSDLVVGVPGQKVAGQDGAGQIVRLQGSPSGLHGLGWVLDEAELGSGGAQAGAGFGSTIAVGLRTALAVGVPGRDLGTVKDAGQIVLLTHLNEETPEVNVIRQGAPGAGTAESGDRLGEVMTLFDIGLEPILVAGIPREDVGSKVDAGAVLLSDTKGDLSMVTQDSRGAAGTAEAGDRYGASVSLFTSYTTHLAGIAPGETLGSARRAGSPTWASLRDCAQWLSSCRYARRARVSVWLRCGSTADQKATSVRRTG